MTVRDIDTSTPNFLRIMGKVLKQPQYINEAEKILSFTILSNDGIKLNIITKEKIKFFLKKDSYVLVEAEFVFAKKEKYALNCILKNVWPISSDFYFTKQLKEEENEKNIDKKVKKNLDENIKLTNNDNTHSLKEKSGTELKTKSSIDETPKQNLKFTIADIEKKIQ